jgi:hypothetical protein
VKQVVFSALFPDDFRHCAASGVERAILPNARRPLDQRGVRLDGAEAARLALGPYLARGPLDSAVPPPEFLFLRLEVQGLLASAQQSRAHFDRSLAIPQFVFPDEQKETKGCRGQVLCFLRYLMFKVFWNGRGLRSLVISAIRGGFQFFSFSAVQFFN